MPEDIIPEEEVISEPTPEPIPVEVTTTEIAERIDSVNDRLDTVISIVDTVNENIVVSNLKITKVDDKVIEISEKLADANAGIDEVRSNLINAELKPRTIKPLEYAR